MIRLYGPSFVGAAIIAGVHLFIGRFRFVQRSDSGWLDVIAGVTIAYVFVDILPHLAGEQQKLAAATDTGMYGYLEHHAYLLALAGFLVLLALNLFVHSYWSARSASELSFRDLPFVIQAGSMSLVTYSFMIGYMLAEQPTHRVEPALLFAIAMAAHFVGLNRESQRLFPRVYDSVHRYLMTLALFAGWATAVFSEISDEAFALCFSFLAGGVIVATTVDELPRIKARRQFLLFSAGALAFTGIILLLESVRG